ncbi:MAG: hypothetical protein SOW25_08175, partial [Helicobacter sp.]|nr:hypothetical protein [Helicobacter sp.]
RRIIVANASLVCWNATAPLMLVANPVFNSLALASLNAAASSPSFLKALKCSLVKFKKSFACLV